MSYKIKIAVVVMLMSLSACSGGGGISEYCAVANPIYISKDDGFTDLTARQLLDHNETGEKICKWKAPKK